MKKLMVGLAAMTVVVFGVPGAEADSHSDGLLLGSLLGQFQQLLHGIIIMTDGECAALGEGWQPYAELSGRFPLAAGNIQDSDRTFGLGQEGGSYEHKLTEPEMPAHGHSMSPLSEVGHSVDGNGSSQRIDSNDGVPWGNWVHPLRANDTGGSKPHNNMPPYRVVNFCHMVRQSE